MLPRKSLRGAASLLVSCGASVLLAVLPAGVASARPDDQSGGSGSGSSESKGSESSRREARADTGRSAPDGRRRPRQSEAPPAEPDTAEPATRRAASAPEPTARGAASAPTWQPERNTLPAPAPVRDTEPPAVDVAVAEVDFARSPEAGQFSPAAVPVTEAAAPTWVSRPAAATAITAVPPSAGATPPASLPRFDPAPAPAPIMRAAAPDALVSPSDWLTGGGSLPALAPVSWLVAAQARREWRGAAPAATAVPSRPVAAATVSNLPPVITAVTVGRGDPATGVVTAVITATDPNNDRLTFTAANTSRGRVSITSAGRLTYTPTTAARHAAAKEQAAPQALSDTVTVTVYDSKLARTSTAVRVPIVPLNAAPVASTTVGTPNSSTGVVTGRVSATDADRDTLSFSAPTTTAKGGVQLSATGGFTYTPTGAARHAAARTGAGSADKTDTFTVTIRDGYGAVVGVPVTVTIAPRNSAPVAGTTTVGTPDPTTAVVTGTVRGTDADGDALSFSAPAATAKGSLSVNSRTGAFTYSPSAAARTAAAAPGATDADRRDGFTVTIADGYGGSAAVAVSVPVSPATAPVNRPPTGTVTVNPADPVTGRVTGTVVGSDQDGDRLTYSAPSSTSKGQVSLNATNGSFSYTPTQAARDAAAAPGANDAARRDGFTVTVADGRGGTAAVPVSVPVTPTPTTPTSLAAFPGAEGFGASATGGRGGSVVYVTNLNADGPGSLQWAIDQPGAKYILFKVSGVINSQIHLTNGNVTIAGQTSPGGITVRGFVTDESPYQDQDVRAPGDFAENWILQHIRIRPGASGPSDDGLRLRYTRNAIVDHVSIGNATDEAIEISYSNNITVQNTILAETLGYHAEYGGILMNYSNPAYGFQLDNVSLHHNVFNRIWGRLPEGSRESLAAANSTMNLEMSNNLYWDPRFFVALGLNTGVVTDSNGDPYPIHWKINAVNNYFRTGTSFPYGMFDDQIMRDPVNQLYVSGNRMSGYPTRSDYQLFYCCNDYAALTDSDVAAMVAEQQAQKRTIRHPFPAITYTPTDQLRTVLLSTAGAWPRDPMDTRLMQNVAANTISTARIDTNPAGDALRPAFSGTAPAAPADTDNDGMPDSWEVAKGLNPAVANTNATTLSPLGYTDLEVYLHELSASRVNGTAL